MTRIKCSVCKKEIFQGKYFKLAIVESPGSKEMLRLCFCSWNCLKEVIESPERIIIELL